MKFSSVNGYLATVEDLADDMRVDSESREMLAKDVPVGGIFSYQDEMFIRSSGRGRITNKKFSTLSRPCVGVSLETGDVVGLEWATVDYYPNATLVS